MRKHAKALTCDIVIVSYNSHQCLEKCLHSLSQNCADSIGRLFIVDNGQAKSIRMLKGILPHTIIIQNDRNLGFSKAVNIGIKLSDASYLCLLNPDTIVEENFLHDGLEYLEAHKKVGALGPRIYSDDGSIQGSARSFPTLLTSLFGRTSLLTRTFPNNKLSRRNMVNIGHDGPEPLPVDWVSGACMLVRQTAIEHTGGLDERFFMYWEDADWCRRMREGGWRVVYYPKSSIVHACGQSSQTRPVKSIFHFHKSCCRLYVKYARGGRTLLLPLVLLAIGGRMGLLIMRTMFVQAAMKKDKSPHASALTKAACRQLPP